MLVLTRGVHKSIIIGNKIVITVLNVKGKYVKIGVDAPDDISIYREEIYDKISRERDDFTE